MYYFRESWKFGIPYMEFRGISSIFSFRNSAEFNANSDGSSEVWKQRIPAESVPTESRGHPTLYHPESARPRSFIFIEGEELFKITFSFATGIFGKLSPCQRKSFKKFLSFANRNPPWIPFSLHTVIPVGAFS